MTTQPDDHAPRVVLVDDTRDLRDLLRLALSRNGFAVVGEAGDGAEGIEVCEREQPDVVLLDLAMPVMDGIEALPRIRDFCPAAIVVVLSGFGAQQMAARAVAAGADGYVQKGASLKKILGYVRDLVDGRTGRPAPSLSLVAAADPRPPSAPRTTDPGTPDPEATSEPTDRGTHVRLRPVSDPETSPWTHAAVATAPYGVVELVDSTLRVVRLNPTAERLLGSPLMEAALADSAPALASVVESKRTSPQASFEADGPHGRLLVRQLSTEESVLLFLDRTPEEASVLRRAIRTAAHEIRGPVTVLAGVAETVDDIEDMSVADRARMMQAIIRQTRLLDDLTADLLTSAQIQRGTLRLDRRPLDPAEAVRAAVHDEFAADVEVLDHRQVDADPVRVEQMLTNLLRNALKYGAPPYEIVVRPSLRPDLLCLEVADRGPGVPEEFVPRLFTEYGRAEHDALPGNGLGLFVVRTLAEAHGGQAAYRPREGGGAVFGICLPAVEG